MPLPTLLPALVLLASSAPEPISTGENPQRTASAFVKVAEVLRHPRCRNCHPAGDRPLQGDPPRPHRMNVQRRLEEVGMACATCHQITNTPGANRPPGAPHWQLAPRAMVFEGRSPRQLCEQLKNPATNGGKTLEEVFHHVAEDALVLWGWAPGEGREHVPVSHADFVAATRAWIDSGAACPSAGEGGDR